jgi:hypothetical protein
MEARSLRDELQASMDELGGAPGPDTIQPKAPDLPEDGGGAEPAALAEPAAEAPKPDAETGERPRGPDGKFLAKTDAAPAAEGAKAAAPAPEPTPTPETAKPEGTEAQAEPIRVPPSLPAAIKAKFGSLDPDVRQAFVALEDSVQKAKAEWGEKGQRLNRFDQLIGPRLSRWQMSGLDEFSGIQTLLAAQDVLDSNPLKGIVEIGRSYGVSPAQIAQAFGLSQASAAQPGQEGQPAPTVGPDFERALQQYVAPLQQGFQTLQQQLQQSQQAAEAAEINRLAAQVQAFADDPKNLYFNDVLDDVVELIRVAKGRNQELSLAEAYERAIWASPEVRPLLIKAQADAEASETARKAEEQRKAADAAARAKAQAAQQASGSVTGSPAPGGQTPRPAFGSVREAAVAAIQELSGT